MTNWIARRSIATLAITVAFVATSRAEPRVSLRVNVNVAMAPANLLVVMHVPPDKRNRGLTVVADSGEYYRSTYIELEGSHDAEIQQVWFKALPAGEYDVTAELEGAGGVLGKAVTRVRVLSSAAGG